MEPDEIHKRLAVIFSKLAVELRILSDLGYRLEYAVSEHFFQARSSAPNNDLQILDLMIQSTDALERLAESLAGQCRSGQIADLGEAATELVLRDMIERLCDTDPVIAPVEQVGPESGLELL